MCLIPLSSICPPYRNRSNHSNMDEDEGVGQPLIDTAQTDGLSATTDQLLSYIGEQADKEGYFECALSVSSFVMAIVVVYLHSIEKYHENHEEILGTQTFNLIVMTSVYVHRILSCSTSSISWSKRAAKWLQSKRSSEQSIVAGDSSIAQRSTGCFSSIIQCLKHLENMDNRLYFGFQLGYYILCLRIFYLHTNEKDHENHEKMLQLEMSSVVYSFMLNVIQIKKTIAQNREQSSLLPLVSVPKGNYQTITSLT